MVLVQSTPLSVLHYSIHLKEFIVQIEIHRGLDYRKTHNYLYQSQRKAADFHTQNRNQDKKIHKSEIGWDYGQDSIQSPGIHWTTDNYLVYI